MTADLVVRNSVAVADPNSPSHVIKPNADGSVNVTGVSGTFEATEKNTAADPSYTEGTVNPLSGTLAGYLRVIANLFQIGGTSILTGTGAQGAGSPRVTVATDTATIAGSTVGTAGTPSANVVSVQGVSGGIGVTSNVTQVGGTNVSTGTGAQGAGAQRITVATDTATVAGSATLPAGSNTIGKIDILGNAGAILDAVLTPATAPANGIAVLGQYNSSLPSPTTGQSLALQLDSKGSANVVSRAISAAFGDGLSNTQDLPASVGGVATYLTMPSYILGFNGTTWDRVRTAAVGNNVAATGIMSSNYGQYLANASQPAASTGNFTAIQMTPDGAMRTAPQRPATGDILVGYLNFTSTTGATTLITVPAGRTWVGRISASVTAALAAANTGTGESKATFATAGTNVTPAAATFFVVDTLCGPNAATGTVGTQSSNFGATPFTITAPAGNTVTISVATTQTGSTMKVDASAIGNLQ